MQTNYKLPVQRTIPLYRVTMRLGSMKKINANKDAQPTTDQDPTSPSPLTTTHFK